MVKTNLVILKKTNLLKLSIVLLIMLNVIIIALKYFEKEMFVKLILENKEEKDLIKDVFLLNIFSYQSKVNDQFVYFIANKDSILLSNLSKDKKKLIVYFKGTNCNLCVDSAIAAIRLSKISPKDVILITNITNRNQIYIAQNNYIGYKVFSIKEKLGISFEDLNYPFYFILDSNSFAICPFIPDKSLPLMTKEYLSHVKEYL